MAYWLLKTEPSSYSFTNLETDKRTVWDGVSNNLALKYLRQMKKGDLALIYHTGGEKALIGIAKVTSDSYADPKGGDNKKLVVDLIPERRLTKPITLAEIKANVKLKDFLLVKMARLSVMPVTEGEWDILFNAEKLHA